MIVIPYHPAPFLSISKLDSVTLSASPCFHRRRQDLETSCFRLATSRLLRTDALMCLNIGLGVAIAAVLTVGYGGFSIVDHGGHHSSKVEHLESLD